jgi:hypothetical protein
MGLADEGLEFVRLQEDSVRAAQEWLANGVKLLQLQQRNAEFVQSWMGDALEAVREQSEHNVRTTEAFARGVSRQQEGLRTLTQGWTGAYRDFFSPLFYVQEGVRSFQRATQQGLEATEQVARQGLRATEQVTRQGLRVAEEATEQVARQGLRATEQVTRQGLRVAEEATEQTEDVLRQTEKITREAELRTAVFSALKTPDYDGLTVEEISERLEGLSTEQLEQVREYEKHNKNRETLIGQIDRKIKAKNS